MSATTFISNTPVCYEKHDPIDHIGVAPFPVALTSTHQQYFDYPASYSSFPQLVHDYMTHSTLDLTPAAAGSLLHLDHATDGWNHTWPEAKEHHTLSSPSLATNTLTLSPRSERSTGSGSSNTFFSPTASPIDLRGGHDLPRVVRTSSNPELVQPFVADHHDPSPNSPPQKEKEKSQLDADAESFLKSRLGEVKWKTFYARLSERRLASSRMRKDSGDESSGTASVYLFLLKVECVKEVLRTLVPNPYSPEKFAVHSFACPKGHVRLTRDTVLSLAGWSNTQFSYWMRRVEAISVFAPYDETFAELKEVLYGLLYNGVSHTSLPDAPGVTGKGIDALIDTVKRQTGIQPYVRGKHASLDAFCAAELGPMHVQPPALATFQPQMYSHEKRVADQSRRKRKRTESLGDIHVVEDCTQAASAFMYTDSFAQMPPPRPLQVPSMPPAHAANVMLSQLDIQALVGNCSPEREHILSDQQHMQSLLNFSTEPHYLPLPNSRSITYSRDLEPTHKRARFGHL